MINILPGATNQTIDVFIQDSSATDGSGLTGLVYNTASLTCYYRRGATGTATALTLATQTVGGAHSDGGFVAIDGTNCPGLYRLDLSDAIVASGVDYVSVFLHGAANMAPTVVRIYLEDKVAVTDILSDGVALNCTSGTLDAVTTAGSVTGAVGSVASGGITAASIATGAIDADALAADAVAEIADGVWDEAQADHVSAGSFGIVASEIADILVDTAEIGAAGAGLTNINLPNQTMDIVGNITGNLSGSVGSVSGNVDGNVTGSIGSLAAQAKADVNAEVLDCLRTDVLAELAAIPAANAAIADKINWMFLTARNKFTQNLTTGTIFADDDTTPVATSAVSTAAGTTTRAKFA